MDHHKNAHLKCNMDIIFPFCPEGAIAIAQGTALCMGQDINHSPERALANL